MTNTAPEPNLGSPASTQRYTRVAMWLHWAIALVIIGNLIGGLVMEDLPQSIRFLAYQMHKSFGLTVLFLTLARIAWRFMNPPPPLPAGMTSFERIASHGVHLAFYVLMIAIPLTGWAMVSASPTGVPTILFNVIPWPDLPIAASETTEDFFYEAHEYLAFGAIGLLVLHVAAALKHQFVNKDGLLGRMGLGPGAPAARRPGATRIFAIVAALAAAIAVVGMAAGAASGRADPVGARESALTAGAPVSAQEAGAPASAQVGLWRVDAEASSLEFSGLNSGKPFTGRFDDWTAKIDFDVAAPADAAIEVRVATASATTGDRYNDGSLGEADWLDPEAHPEAVFTATGARVVDAGAGRYALDGSLTLKGVTQAVSLPFTLQIEGDTATATGATTVSRLAFDVGRQADASAEWVGDDVTITVTVVASRA